MLLIAIRFPSAWGQSFSFMHSCCAWPAFLLKVLTRWRQVRNLPAKTSSYHRCLCQAVSNANRAMTLEATQSSQPLATALLSISIPRVLHLQMQRVRGARTERLDTPVRAQGISRLMHSILPDARHVTVAAPDQADRPEACSGPFLQVAPMTHSMHPLRLAGVVMQLHGLQQAGVILSSPLPCGHGCRQGLQQEWLSAKAFLHLTFSSKRTCKTF